MNNPMDADRDATPTAAEGLPTGQEGSRARLERLLAVLQKALGHELPNHLIALQGLTRLLELEEGERLSAAGKEYLGRLAAGAAKAHALVAALAEVARPETAPGPAETVDLAELAAEVIAEAKQLAPGAGVEYHAPQQAFLLPAPRTALRQALALLLRRAGTAGAGGRPLRVDVSARATATGAEIRVADDGEAVPGEMIDRLFDPFGGTGGPGLDLFLVRQLAEGWGGTVRVESEPGRGTAFVVTCPLSPVPCP
jgi:signal transduction histidine kinase